MNSNFPFRLNLPNSSTSKTNAPSPCGRFTVWYIQWPPTISYPSRRPSQVKQGDQASCYWYCCFVVGRDSSIHRSLQDYNLRTMTMSTSSSSSTCHRRWGCGVGKCLLIPMMIALISSIAHAKSESVITPKKAGKKSSTTFKHKYGAAVRRILHYQPSQFERSLQGGNNNVSAVLYLGYACSFDGRDSN